MRAALATREGPAECEREGSSAQDARESRSAARFAEGVGGIGFDLARQDLEPVPRRAESELGLRSHEYTRETNR